MKEIIAPDGQMCVSRQRKLLGYIVQTPDDEDSDWELLTEDDALALKQEWHQTPEPPMTDPSAPRDQTYDSERTSGEA